MVLLIYIVDSEEGSCECGGLAEGHEQGGVDLALRVDEDAAKEKNEASEGKDGSGK